MPHPSKQRTLSPSYKLRVLYHESPLKGVVLSIKGAAAEVTTFVIVHAVPNILT